MQPIQLNPLRICRGCGLKAYTQEDLEAFQREKKCTYGRKNRCTDCGRQANRVYHKKNREQRASYDKEHYANNKDVLQAKMKNYYDTHTVDYSIRAGIRHKSKLQRIPGWLTEADFKYMKSLYVSSALITKLTGIAHHVDHIIPLRGALISGLHCPSNLQIIPAKENLSKGNKWTI